MISLEVPKKFETLVGQANQVAAEILRPNSRKYDLAEHEYPKELDMLAALIDGMNDGGSTGGAAPPASAAPSSTDEGNRNGSNMATVLGVIEMCWGDVGLTLSMPRQGLGNSAIASVADDEQSKRFEGKWAAMAITEPEAGSDSAAIRTTAKLDEETGEYVLNGEKIFVTAGERADLIVVWASLDPSQGRAAIKSFVVERDNPGLKLDRLEHKLGIKASDTANFVLDDCRVPQENLLGTPEIDMKKSFARRDEDLRQHPAARRRDGRRRRPRLHRAHQGAARRGRRRGRLRPPGAEPERRRRRAARARGRLRGRPPADARGGMDGRQLEAELAPCLLREGEGRPLGDRHRAALRRALRRRPATARTSCSRSGLATRRSSTSSRARSRSSS